MTFTEGNLQIDIADAVGGRRFEDQHGLSHCMKAVDLVVELPDRYLYIELKDPQHPRATSESRGEFIEQLLSGRLDEALKYKYRDSFLYEWASGRADKPVDFLVLIALNTLDEAQLLTRTEALTRILPQRGPDGQPWQRDIVSGCGVFNLESWIRRFPGYPVNRTVVPAGRKSASTTRLVGAAPERLATLSTSARDDAMRERRRRLAQEQAVLLPRVGQALFGLRERLGVRTAYVLGSLRSPDLWHETSDVDVAVGGCSRDVLEVMKAIEDVTGRDVDVIDLDRHPSPESCVRAGFRVYG
jgi:predicted nucleotidyltransferase